MQLASALRPTDDEDVDSAAKPNKPRKPRGPGKPKKPPADSDDIVMPIFMETRLGTDTRVAERYLLHSTPKNKYVAGQSIIVSARYRENVDTSKGKLESKEIVTKTAAREWLASVA